MAVGSYLLWYLPDLLPNVSSALIAIFLFTWYPGAALVFVSGTSLVRIEFKKQNETLKRLLARRVIILLVLLSSLLVLGATCFGHVLKVGEGIGSATTCC